MTKQDKEDMRRVLMDIIDNYLYPKLKKDVEHEVKMEVMRLVTSTSSQVLIDTISKVVRDRIMVRLEIKS